MDKETAKLFPTIDKDILEKMNEEEPQEDVAVKDIPRQKIIKHKEVFINTEEEKVEEKVELKQQEAPKKKKEYPHLVKARAKAKANREARKQAKLEEKLQNKQATKGRRLEKQRVASKERYWKNKEVEEQQTLREYATNKNIPTHADGFTYEQFRKYQSKYDKEKQAKKLEKEKTKLEEENKRLKKQINTKNSLSFNRNPNYPDYFNTGNRLF
tara:strand:- start:1235 stop:1873 length:639 start_codon:yes stop_codon:yes gene_type:complete